MVKMDTTGLPEGTEETANMANMAKMVLRLSIIFDEKITLVFSYKAQFLCRISFVSLFTKSNLLKVSVKTYHKREVVDGVEGFYNGSK